MLKRTRDKEEREREECIKFVTTTRSHFSLCAAFLFWVAADMCVNFEVSIVYSTMNFFRKNFDLRARTGVCVREREREI